MKLWVVAAIALAGCNVTAPPPSSSTPTRVYDPLPAKTIAGVQVFELESFVTEGNLWRNFVIPSTISRDSLIAVAKELHSSDPKMRCNFLDDASGFEKFKQEQIHYPTDAAYPVPEDWYNKHYIGMMNQVVEPDGMKWKLTLSVGGRRFVLPDQTDDIALE